MSKLLFLSKGTVAPKDAQKVYFCAHADDVLAYLKPLGEKVLTQGNCVVFYPENADAPFTKDDEVQLAEMQAFVVPVTHRLLSESNRALEKEIPFAIRRHIPILFIMMERELQDLFNTKCGNLHLISAVDDPEYEKKAEKFLERVLVGDELAKKVRDAFGAYVFVSYRKKDKAYVKPLMQLIHKDDQLRDVAIWYDEFLTPGEDFNDSIKDALKKSALFALAVTPNLMEEGNYVMTTEYPMACAEGKCVVPVELVKTNIEEVKRKFKGITSVFSADGGRDFYATIENAVRDLPLAERTPEHDYLIGLAYLNGIDVEIDHVKAAQILNSASERGSLGAKRKLVEMYGYGMGVEKDVVLALRLGNELFQEYQHRIRSAHRLEDSLAFASVATELDLLYVHASISQHDAYDRYAHANVFIKLRAVLEEESLRHTAQLRAALAECYSAIGSDVTLSKALPYNDEEKNETLQKAIELYEDLAAESPKYKAELARICSILGTALYHYDLERAYEVKKRAHELFLELLKENGDYAYDIAQNMDFLVEIATALGYTDEAERLSEENLSFVEKTLFDLGRMKLNHDGKDMLALNVSTVYLSLSQIYQANGKTERAIELLQSGIEKYQPLADNDPAQYRGIVIGFYNNLASVYQSSEDTYAAELYYQRAVELAREACVCGGTAETLQLCNTLGSLAGYYKYVGEMQAALECYDELIALKQDSLVEITSGYAPGADAYDVLRIYSEIIGLHIQEYNLDEAMDMVSEALTLMQRLHEALPDENEPSVRAAELYERASFIYKLAGDEEMQIATAERRVDLLEEVLQFETDVYATQTCLKNCADAYNALAEIYHEIGDFDSAENAYAAALDKLATVDADNVEEIAYTSGKTFYNVARLYSQLGRKTEALDYANMAVNMFEMDEALGSLMIDDAKQLVKELKNPLSGIFKKKSW